MPQRAIPRKSVVVTAGDLRYLLQIQQDSQTEDEGGGRPQEPWQMIADDFFALRPANANEQYLAAQRKMMVTHVAYSRWRNDISIDSSLRLYWADEGRTFAVHGVYSVDERDRLFVWKLEETLDES